MCRREHKGKNEESVHICTYYYHRRFHSFTWHTLLFACGWTFTVNCYHWWPLLQTHNRCDPMKRQLWQVKWCLFLLVFSCLSLHPSPSRVIVSLSSQSTPSFTFIGSMTVACKPKCRNTTISWLQHYLAVITFICIERSKLIFRVSIILQKYWQVTMERVSFITVAPSSLQKRSLLHLFFYGDKYSESQGHPFIHHFRLSLSLSPTLFHFAPLSPL